MFHPTRGGTRGGRDQFKWEDVKEDKHRENYLGNSLHAAVGRWQKGRDITWYAKSGDASEQADGKKAEIQSIKDAEAEAMAEALGYKKKRKTETNVTESELKSAINKSSGGVEDDLDEKLKESSKVEGLGFGSRAQAMYSQAGTNSKTKTSAVPIVPLIPNIITSEQSKDSNSRDGRVHSRSENDRKRHRSRSVSPSSRSKRHRDRSRSKERRESRKDREKGRDRHRSKREVSAERTEDRSRKHRSKSRSRSRERNHSGSHSGYSRDHQHGDSRSHKSRREYRSRSRSRSRGQSDSRTSRK